MKIVLHICCGVCAGGVAQILQSEGHEVEGFFYNPNIYPEEEYFRRLEAAKNVADRAGFELQEAPYHPETWHERTQALKYEPEGGQRCALCYRIRLNETFQYMLSTGADMFTTTLTVSPHKPALQVNTAGYEVGAERYLSRDFKKKDGFKKTMDMAKQWGIYRQTYCGCIYSMKERSA